jgi:membrane-bound lytic murein transglycosylase D
MAAYDWGAGKVQRAVQRTGYADFWELYQRNVLPAETKNYVPIIVAAAIMAKNPSQYGLSDIPVDPPLGSDTVTTDSSINLRLVADLVGTTTEQIQELNPSLLQMSTPSDFSFDLHLPPGTAPLFQQRLAIVPEDHRNAWRFHIATQEDTLASIAQTFHVTTKELAAANGMRSDDSIHANQALLIPVPPPVSFAHMRYRVHRGDTMVTLADRFGVTTSQLRRWNGFHGNRLPVGRTIYVSEPVRRHHRRSRYEHGSTAHHSSSSHASSASKAHHSGSSSHAKTSSSKQHKKKTD